MDIDSLREYCLGFPYSTENVQWGSDLCFKVDGKLFAVAPLEVAPVSVSFKCTPENFAELCERPGVRPAAYMARAQWVSLERFNTLPDAELRELLGESYRLVWERLPKRRRAELESKAAQSAKTAQGVAKTNAKSKKKASGSLRTGSAAKAKSAPVGRRG